MLIVAGTLTVDPDHRDQMLESVAPMVEATMAEAGCQDYVFSPDPNDSGLVRLFELWDDEAALAEHFASDHMAAWRARAADLPITSRSIAKYAVSGAEPLG